MECHCCICRSEYASKAIIEPAHEIECHKHYTQLLFDSFNVSPFVIDIYSLTQKEGIYNVGGKHWRRYAELIEINLSIAHTNTHTHASIHTLEHIIICGTISTNDDASSFKTLPFNVNQNKYVAFNAISPFTNLYHRMTNMGADRVSMKWIEWHQIEGSDSRQDWNENRFWTIHWH